MGWILAIGGFPMFAMILLKVFVQNTNTNGKADMFYVLALLGWLISTISIWVWLCARFII